MVSKKHPGPDDLSPDELFDTTLQDQTWPLLQRALELDVVRTLYVHGPPGIGKTYGAYRYGRIERGVYAITMTEDTPASELRGFFSPHEGSAVWRDGPFTTAMRRGARLVINEISHASPECLALLHPVLESFETARLTLPNDETICPAEGFNVVVTDNAPPDQLPPALADRFDCVFEVIAPHPDALALLNEPYRSAAARSCHLQEERRIGLRPWFSLQKLEPVMGLEQACCAVFGVARGKHVHDALRIATDKLGKEVKP